MSDRSSPEPTAPKSDRTDAESATIEEIFADLITLREESDDTETREEILDIKQLLVEAHDRGLIDSGVRHLDRRDAAEAFVGSVIFASPLLVEGGVFDIGTYLFQFTPGGVPVFLLLNTAFVVLMTYALLEWTGQDRDETRLLFGIVPVRLLMTLAVSFVVATLLMTVWGRVGGWQSPVEALARINVIWTVGSLGAGLGDIISEGETPPEVTVENAVAQRGARLIESGEISITAPPAEVQQMSDSALVDALHREFDELESVVDGSADQAEVNRLREETVDATLADSFGDRIEKYTSRDIAEAFVGSIFFAIPFLVEDGVFDIADFFLSFRIGVFPVYFLINTAFVLLMILALVYWAGPQEVHVNQPILGFIPRRMVGIAVVSFLTAAAMMTMWGRVDNWADPVVALARVSVVWTVASFGAALGDILPGESSGSDINDELREIGG
jgi:uncharacterized membrane protein